MDWSKVKKVCVKDTKVEITIPRAIVTDAKVNSTTLNSDSFYYDDESQKPTASQETAAFNQAQQNMIDVAKSNATLLANAQENAKELLENYVQTISEATNIDYKIEWIEDNES